MWFLENFFNSNHLPVVLSNCPTELIRKNDKKTFATFVVNQYLGLASIATFCLILILTHLDFSFSGSENWWNFFEKMLKFFALCALSVGETEFNKSQCPREDWLFDEDVVCSKVIFVKQPLRFKKAGRFEKLLGFARSHSIVTRGSVSPSCATRSHPSCFSKSQR